MIVYRNADVSSTSPYHCTIGFQLPASAASLTYDMLLSSLYTGVFIRYALFPNTAQQTAHQATSLRIMARRSIVATVVSMITAAVNYCVLIGLDGQERGLVASTICALDISIVVCVVHWGKYTFIYYLYKLIGEKKKKTHQCINDIFYSSLLLLVATHPSEMQCTVKALTTGVNDKPMKLEIKQHQEVVVLSELAP